MRKSLLLLALILAAPSVVLPVRCVPSAMAQTQSGLPKAQVDAIDQWAAVIRKGKNPKVMYQVAGLLKQVISKVEARKDERNYNFVIALQVMHQAAKLRAQGLEKRNQKLLDVAESRIRSTVQVMHGIPWCGTK